MGVQELESISMILMKILTQWGVSYWLGKSCVEPTWTRDAKVQFSSSKIFLNLELDFRFGLGNQLNFELDHWYRFRTV
jgi:hypothetical protein